MRQGRILRIVVASPSDVEAERNALPQVIDELNRDVAAERGLWLQLLRWETDAHPGFHLEGPQGLIDASLGIEDCDLLIGIFWKRFGTPVKNANSGTEHELNLAYEAWRQQGRPQIFVYFNQEPYTPQSRTETDQWGQVLDFREQFPKEGLWWAYEGKAQFEQLVRQHLTHFICDRFPLSPQANADSEANSSLIQTPNTAVPVRPIDELMGIYRAHLADQVSKVRILGKSEPQSLEKVFVELTVTEEYQRPAATARYGGSVDAELWQRRTVLASDEEATQPGAPEARGGKRMLAPDELLRSYTRAVIVGAPGCGKTTLLRYLTGKTLQAGNRLPVFLELKRISEEAFVEARGKLTELLFEKAVATSVHLNSLEHASLKEHFFARLATGDIAIFLDGLDEVSGAEFFPKLCNSINEFLCSAYRDNDLIISTRPYALQTRFEGLREMEIAPLSLRQIEEFVLFHFGRHPKVIQLLEHVRRNRDLQDLGRIPFLLTLLASLYLQQDHIVDERLEIYRRIVQLLLSQHDHEKLVKRFYIFDPEGTLKREFLKQLAYERLFVDRVEKDTERLVFTGDEILKKAQRFYQSELRPDLLAADVKATPLLREIGADTYAFAHLTLQEYLAATSLAERDDCERIFCRTYFDPTLAEMEVLPMTLGLLGGETERYYSLLDQLPESLDYKSLRLQARGLAYAEVSDARLQALAKKREEFLYEDHPEKAYYRNAVYQAFAGAHGRAKDLIESSSAEPSRLRQWTEAALTVLSGKESLRPVAGRDEQVDVTIVPELLAKLFREGLGHLSSVEQLSRFSHGKLAQGLLLSLSYDNSLVRQKAASVIGYYTDDEQTLKALTHLADNDPVTEVRDAARAAVEKFKLKLKVTGLEMPALAAMEAVGREQTLEETRSFIAHEIKNSIGPLRTVAQMLEEALASPDFDKGKLAQFAQLIVKQTGAAYEVVNQYVDYTRPLNADLQPTDLHQLVNEALDEIRTECAPLGIAISRQFDLKQLVRLDRGMMAQVLRNVLCNALEAMDSGGQLTIATRQDEQHGILTISDTGPGIKPGNLLRMFELGFTTKLGKRGAGIGLALSRRLITEMRGRISIDNKRDGRGVVVTIELPIAQAESHNGQ